MKICYIANARMPTGKAHGFAVMKMCEAFADEGATVELIIPYKFSTSAVDLHEHYGIKKNFKITKLPCLDVAQRGKAGFFIQWFTFAIAVFFYSLFHRSALYYGRDDLSLWLVSLWSRKVVWESHTAKTGLYIRSLLRRSKAVVVISDGLKKHHLAAGIAPEKVFVTPSGVDIEMFEKIKESKEELRQKLRLPKGKKIVAYIGKLKTMGETKGVKELSQSFEELIETRQDAFLLLVGASKKDVKESNNQKILPLVPSAEVPLYMKASDVLVMNYPHTDHYAYYMSPLKLFEYMASGTPLVTSDLPSIREVVDEKSAYFFDLTVPHSLTNALHKVLDQSQDARERADRAQQRVRNFSWKERARRIMKLVILT